AGRSGRWNRCAAVQVLREACPPFRAHAGVTERRRQRGDGADQRLTGATGVGLTALLRFRPVPGPLSTADFIAETPGCPTVSRAGGGRRRAGTSALRLPGGARAARWCGRAW